MQHQDSCGSTARQGGEAYAGYDAAAAGGAYGGYDAAAAGGGYDASYAGGYDPGILGLVYYLFFFPYLLALFKGLLVCESVIFSF